MCPTVHGVCHVTQVTYIFTDSAVRGKIDPIGSVIRAFFFYTL